MAFRSNSSTRTVHCLTKEQWDIVCNMYEFNFTVDYSMSSSCIWWEDRCYGTLEYAKEKNYEIYNFEQWCAATGNLCYMTKDDMTYLIEILISRSIV